MNLTNLVSSDQSHITELPTDMILEIFFKLSTKHLLISRGVCKSWYDLITNPNFAIDYSRNSPFITIAFSQRSYSYKDFFLLEITPNREFIQKPIKPKVPKHSELDSFLSVIGLFNGLLFLVLRTKHNSCMKEQVYFCNPLFKGCYELEEYKIARNVIGLTQYQLGFVPSINKFKLLRSVFQEDGRFEEADIFTVGEDDKWRRLEEPLALFRRKTQGTFLNGVYHYYVEDENDVYIYTFDYEKEKGGQVLRAPKLLEKYWGRRITVLNNHLCIVEIPMDFKEIIVWTMQKYRVSSSWSSKKIVLMGIPRKIDAFELIPIEILRNGDIIFSHWLRSKLICLNGETNTCTEIKVSDRNFESSPYEITSHATMYAPQFYSIERAITRGQYGVFEMSD